MVTFVDDHGVEEPGLDHGGLMKELIEEVMRAGLDPQAGLFQANADGLLYPSPLAKKLEHGSQMLRFLGEDGSSTTCQLTMNSLLCSFLGLFFLLLSFLALPPTLVVGWEVAGD